MSETRNELVVTGIATAEIMERIRNAHDETVSSKASEATANTAFDSGICGHVEALGNSIFLNTSLVSAEDKLNYVCSAAALLVTYTAELMKQMVEASNGSAN